MKTLKLERPICFFDLETTGIDKKKDRIVEIAIIKILPNWERITYEKRINPLMPISKEASEVHGIWADDVEMCQTFEDLSIEILEFIKDCDLGGYNLIQFDIPLLLEEFKRCKIIFSTLGINVIDSYVIYSKKEKRDLTSALKFYTGKDLVNSHSAIADIEATIDVFGGQVEVYDDLGDSIFEISKFGRDPKAVDSDGKVVLDNDGICVFSFGKYKGQSIAKIKKSDSGYYSWLISKADLSDATKEVFKKIEKGELK